MVEPPFSWSATIGVAFTVSMVSGDLRAPGQGTVRQIRPGKSAKIVDGPGRPIAVTRVPFVSQCAETTSTALGTGDALRDLLPVLTVNIVFNTIHGRPMPDEKRAWFLLLLQTTRKLPE